MRHADSQDEAPSKELDDLALAGKSLTDSLEHLLLQAGAQFLGRLHPGYGLRVLGEKLGWVYFESSSDLV
jgi:hypothetical protein